MADFQRDQAEGLRRLLEREHLRVTTVAAGCQGVGKTSVVVNVAAAFAARGRRVLVIDENYGPANVSGLLGVRSRFDLNHVMRGACTLENALIEGPSGISILPAAIAARAWRALPPPEQQRLIESFARLDGRFDMALIDTPGGNAGTPGIFSRAVQDTIIVSSAAADAITASYALIKRMRDHQGGRRFYMLLNRVACESNARVVAANLTQAARGYLATPLEYLGSVPRDVSLAQAARGFQAVVDACPAAPSARGFKRIADSIADWPRGGQRRDGFDSLMHRLLAGSRFVFANAGA
ncbi:MAG: AAA family ATPase [Betaproteobacteria bacterium]|nr:AAA family ATPase [Betaproteobacteria bacterium]